MIPVPSGVRVWLAGGATDMRCGMNSLALEVQESQSRFGRSASNTRFTRSSGHGALVSETVVLTRRPRTAPCKPRVRISRATVQRATGTPSRPNWRQTPDQVRGRFLRTP
jgi:hypothetical protein